MRNYILALLACVLSALFSRQEAFAVPYISVDTDGYILAHNQAFDRWYPASLTKMMTAYITFQALASGKVSLQTPITLSAEAARVEPSRSGWRPGSTFTLDTALTVMLVKSANDMANALAEALRGSQAAFVMKMNAEAQRLGMTGTHFSNPSGLPDTQNYSNARDLALLAVQIRREFPQYAYYFDIPALDFGHGRKIQPNSNNLIGRYNGADGMKTGFICASGFNLVGSATRSGRTVIVVVLGADRIGSREETAAMLLSKAFKKGGTQKISLANLMPYGSSQEQAPNLREQICSLEAGRMRLQYRDEKGHQVFNSPFMTEMTEEPLPLPVRPIYEPPPPPAPPPSAKKKGRKTVQAVNKKTAADKSAVRRAKTTDNSGKINSAAGNKGGIKGAPAANIAVAGAETLQNEGKANKQNHGGLSKEAMAADNVVPKFKERLHIPDPEPWPPGQGLRQDRYSGQGLQRQTMRQNSEQSGLSQQR